MQIVPWYAAILALLFVALSVAVIRCRRRAKVALGTGGDALLERRIRAHANFAEYAPLVLILLGMVELQGAPTLLLHGLCAALVVGRTVHAVGVSRLQEDFRFRVFGTASTLTVTILAAATLLLMPLFGG